MAQLLLISKKTYYEGVNEIGDCVVVMEDDHIFSDHEKDIFNIVEIPGTKATVEMLQRAAMPRKTTLHKTGVVGWTEDPIEEKDVWENDKKEVFEIVAPPTHELRWDGERFIHNLERSPLNTVKAVVESKIVAIEVVK